MNTSKFFYIFFRKKREITAKQKKSAQDYIINKKKDDKNFYDKIMLKSSSISVEDLQEMFPGDEKIIEKFLRFKEERGKTTNNSFSQEDFSIDNYDKEIKYTDGNVRNKSYEEFNNRSFNQSFDKIY